MCSKSKGRKKDNQQRSALTKREELRRNHEAATEFAVTVLKMIG